MTLHARRQILRQILAEERPVGFLDIAEFLNAWDAGELPKREGVARIAAAFERVLNCEIKPGELDRALGLRTARGRPRLTAADLDREAFGEIVRFIRARIESDPNPRGARARAMLAAADRFRIERRRVERIWARSAPVRSAEDEFLRTSARSAVLRAFPGDDPLGEALRAVKPRPRSTKSVRRA